MTRRGRDGPDAPRIGRLGWGLLWVLALGPVLAYLGFLLRYVTSLGLDAVDWQTYVSGATDVLAGRSPYAPWQLSGPYLLGDAAGGNGFVYPPSAAIVLAPFLQPQALWIAFNTLVYVVGIVAVVAASVGLSPLPVAIGLWSALLPPWFLDGIANGGVTPAIAGALGLIYAAAPLASVSGGSRGIRSGVGASVAAGVTAGIGAAIKVYPGAWVALPMRYDAKRALVGAAVGFGIPAAISVALAGVGPWVDYIVAFRNGRPICERALFPAVCGSPLAAMLWIAGVALFVLSFRLPRPWALLVLGFLPILVAPEIWRHYWLMIVPGVVAVAMTYGPRWPKGWTGIKR